MSVQAIIIAAVIVGGVGLFIGFFLGVSGEKFKVEVDEREEAIVGVLPGNNCGGCGYAGCSGLAAAIVKVMPRSMDVLLVVRRLQQKSVKSWVLQQKKAQSRLPL